MEAILAAAKEPVRSQLGLLAFTGMRAGELQWLTWEDIDFEHNVIHVQPKDGWLPKSGRGRIIPMHPRARAILKELPHEHRWVFTAAPSRKYSDGGHQINTIHLLEKPKRILTRIGIKEGKLHSLRHFFISYCANHGVEPFKLMRWVGHSDLKIILTP